MNESLVQPLRGLCRALAALWKESSFSTDFGSLLFKRYEVNTKPDDKAVLMPISGLPIRGSTGVEVSRTEKRLSKKEVTENLINGSCQQEKPFNSEQLNQRLRFLKEAIEVLGRAVDADLPLRYRLHESLGYKTWSAQQFYDQDLSGWPLRLNYFLAIRKRLAQSLVGHGFDPATRGQFEGWSAVEQEIIENLKDLRTQEWYEYEVQIFLNGPPADFEGEASLGDILENEETISVGVSHASDQVVGLLVEHGEVPGYEIINTVLRYRVLLPVDEEEETYLQAYPKATEVGALLLDGLRLLRPGDDIGILALEIVAVDDFAPMIRKTWASRFQTDLARFYPNRFDYRTPSKESALQEGEAPKLGALVSLLLGNSGRSISILQARRRLANSIDRYSPNDPERLIEYAIALESLFLADAPDERNELSYRLAFARHVC